ncbi:MAG TPA: phosphoribosyltransferase family protein [Actinomycetota bacterium]
MVFHDRQEAGRVLTERVSALGPSDPVVLGIARGGVVVAAEVARALGAPLDVSVVRKLGVPWRTELGFGALGEGGVTVLNDALIRDAGLTPEDIDDVSRVERAELERRVRRYRGDRPPVELRGRTAIVVDDGIATGSTIRAALEAVRRRGPDRLILAVPVAPPRTVRALRVEVDELVVVESVEPFFAVGQFYEDFPQTSDAEVTELLAAAPAPIAGAAPGGTLGVEIPAGSARIRGDLTLPPDPVGVVLFAHGSGSSRFSPRNRAVAARLRERRLGTLLLDLLTPDEERDRANVFDIELLADRLGAATRSVQTHPATAGLPVASFGASTGGAAALVAAADPSVPVEAIVSRGGRPDLAGVMLGAVRAPTLLIVGGADPLVLDLNRDAASALRCEHRLEIVPGATHLFEEPGALELVADLAADWFVDHLSRDRAGVGTDPP